MNIPVLIGGILGTTFIGLFFVIAIVDGFKVAFQVLAFVVIMFASSVGVVLFWIWVAGGFARPSLLTRISSKVKSGARSRVSKDTR